jgi:hypothetical protein
MRPIFTIHAGEYLVGSEIEKMFPKARVWIPSKDDGIDLLVTNRKCSRSVSLQVKFSKDYLGNEVKAELAAGVKSGGWWSFDLTKMRESAADYWVLALYRFQARDFDFVVVKPKALASMYLKLSPMATSVQSYVWVTSNNLCWEVRGLKKADQLAVASGSFTSKARDLTGFLNKWDALKWLDT